MKRIIPLLASALALTACGSGSSTPAATLPAGAMVVTAVPSIRFDAKTYGPVPAGDVVIGYENKDSVRHTLIIAKDGVKVSNFRLVIGQHGSVDSGTVKLDKGTYTLLCDVPGHSNMKATLTVK